MKASVNQASHGLQIPCSACCNPDDLLHVEGLTKRFAGASAAAVSDFSFCLAEGDLLSLLGPSGCGKTTTLRMLGGFEIPDCGRIRLGGINVTDLPPERRGVGIVFQDYALFPHLSVLENVMFGLRRDSAGARIGRARRRERAEAMLALVALSEYGGRMPHQLSGGQQQRVALARTLAARPRLVLLDEPFSNLDASLRDETRQEVRALLKKEGVTAILVTHDQEEALAFSDRMAVMKDGRLEQIGAPDEVYRFPATRFVASFLGRSNILAGVAQGLRVETPIGWLPISRSLSGPVSVAVRPEQLVLIPDATPARKGVVISREFRGHDQVYRVRVGDHEVQALTGLDVMMAPGDGVRVVMRDAAVVLEGGEPAGLPHEVAADRPVVLPERPALFAAE